MSALSERIPAFLSSALQNVKQAKENRPYVTLTFAQSLDAKIAGKNGQQVILSGKESMIMTHWMRTMHDAILVGIGTALNDDPQLNTRHLPPAQKPHHLPRPIVLDCDLRFSTDSKLLKNFKNGTGRRPWVLTSAASYPANKEKAETLESAGAKVFPVSSSSGNRLDISNVLALLLEQGVRSLMVEGGAQVIESFLNETGKVDTLIVTVAPRLIGPDGVGYTHSLSQQSHFKYTSSNVIGRDCVFCWGEG